MHFAANPSTDINGSPVGGASGTIKVVSRIVKQLQPDIVYFLLDGPGGSLKKRRLYKDYKEGRKPVVGRNYEFASGDEAQRNRQYQINLLKKLLGFIPICFIETNQYEADDAIAYIVKYTEFFGHRSNIIVTCDKDFYQLVSEKTVIYNPQSKKIYDTSLILEEHEIHPNNWLFYKCINGDASDNVKGIKGFGPKTICKLFDVKNGDIKLQPQVIEEVIKDTKLLSEKLIPKYHTLYDNLEIIKKNWELMSLEELMLSNFQTDELTKKIKDFCPTLDSKKFYIEVMRLGGLGLNPSFVEDFKVLLRSN